MGNGLAAVLLEELADYDGKSTAILGAIEHRWSGEPNYLRALLELFDSDSPAVQNGATWLFKSCVETGQPVETGIAEQLSTRTAFLDEWGAALHICQSVQHLTFAPEDATRLADWVGALLDHDRPFLRAWSLDALVHLSSFSSDLQRDAKRVLANALDDPAASVRARARKFEGRRK